MWAHMGYDAACVDTMEMIMKSWISPHLFGVQLTGRVCACVGKGGCCSVGGSVQTLPVAGVSHS